MTHFKQQKRCKTYFELNSSLLSLDDNQINELLNKQETDEG
jgi:hypothetical protein